jgi:hypothetical protein
MVLALPISSELALIRPDTLIEGTKIAILGNPREPANALQINGLFLHEPGSDLGSPGRLRHITRPASRITQPQRDE